MPVNTVVTYPVTNTLVNYADRTTDEEHWIHPMSARSPCQI